MNILDLMIYDVIFLWGTGLDFQYNYKKQFFVNACVDIDENKVGKYINGIPIIAIRELRAYCDNKKALIVVSTSKYYGEIVERIKKEKIKADIVGLDTMLMIYGHNRNAYSLWGLDIFVADIFERTGFSLPSVSYIDVGANHPFLGNSTANLYLKGARGILIEPTSDCMSDLIKMRKGDICLNCGIESKKGKISLYRFSNLYRNTFSIQEKERNIALGYKFVGEEVIPVYTLDDIIQEYSVDTSCTYLNLMVPRADSEILKEFDYSKYSFPIISFSYSDDKVFQYPICKDYKIFMSMLRRVVLLREDIYNRLL